MCCLVGHTVPGIVEYNVRLLAQGVDSVPKVGYRAQHRTECGIGVMAYVLRRYPQGLFAVKMECFAVVDC